MISYFGNHNPFGPGFKHLKKFVESIFYGIMVLNKDFREFIELLNAHDVAYLIVGGYAVALHGYPRYTKDLDVWIKISEKNAIHIITALRQFGFSNEALSENDFLKQESFVQLGYPPNRIDIATSCDGVEFEECFSNKEEITIDGIKANFIDLEHLKINKKASGRPQDLADLDNLSKK
jgi:hypothetical protein